MPSNFLRSLINSKTRISLLLRFYLNQNLRGYLQGLNNELGENKNSLRSKLNGLEKAGQLSSAEQEDAKSTSSICPHSPRIYRTFSLRSLAVIDWSIAHSRVLVILFSNNRLQFIYLCHTEMRLN